MKDEKELTAAARIVNAFLDGMLGITFVDFGYGFLVTAPNLRKELEPRDLFEE